MYNDTEHSSLFGFTPRQVHFDTEATYLVNKLSMTRFRRHQDSARNLMKSTRQKLGLGDYVLVQLRPRKISKEFTYMRQGRYSKETYRIVGIDTKFLPYTYELEGKRSDDSNYPRRFYSSELLKVRYHEDTTTFPTTPNFQTLNEPESSISMPMRTKLRISDFRITDQRKLRNGKTIPGTGIINYFVLFPGQLEGQWISKDQLRKLRDSSVLEYGNAFDMYQNLVI